MDVTLKKHVKLRSTVYKSYVIRLYGGFPAVANVKSTIMAVLVVLLVVSTIQASDWPQFRGPNRDGKSTETGLLKKWPEGGPKLLWSVDGLGEGYSSIAVAGGLVYTTGMIEKEGVLFAYDLDGKLKWKKTYGPEWRASTPGTRAAPTVEDGRLYLISGEGAVFCFDAKTSERIWTVDAKEKFEGQKTSWGISESALIVGDNVICTPGGKDIAMVALNKLNGQTVWTSKGLSEESSYCSPILIERGSRKLIVNMLAESVVGLDAGTGEVLWKEKEFGVKAINPVSPVYYDGCVYSTSGYDDGGMMLQLSPDGAKVTRKWDDKTLDIHHGGAVLVDGYIYGANWKENPKGDWVCLDWNTGKVIYETKWNGNKGQIIYADGMLYCYDENTGDVALVPATSTGFKPVSSFNIPSGGKKNKHWAHPAISDGRLYIRYVDTLRVYDIKRE